MTVAPWPRATKVTAVAQPSAARTKNCQGCRPASELTSAPARRGTLSVEVAELIVDPLVERGVDRRRCGGRRLALARPLHGRKPDRDGADGANQVRKEPGHPVEAF